MLLLQNFAGVMSKINIEEATHDVMCYCDSDFAKETKDLPKEVLLCLLQRNDIYNPEIELFIFLVKWHDYQTKELKASREKLIHLLYNTHTHTYIYINIHYTYRYRQLQSYS